jgi:hypothetical protein
MKISKAKFAGDDSVCTQYDIRIHTSHTFHKTITKDAAEFDQLRLSLCRALKIGHFCSATCPWFYMCLKECKPKARLFWHRKRKPHVQMYQSLLDDICRFLSSDRHQCYHANETIPSIVSAFLFGDEQKCSGCGHVFHDECILLALSQENTCPCCP